MNIPSVSIVILNWNGEHFLRQFLPVVLQHLEPKQEVCVVDNGSTDQSVELITREFPAARLIRFDQNLGFAKGYNEALSQIDADYYVLLNSDVEVTQGWLRPMIELLQSNDRIAACQPKIKSYKNRDSFEYAGAAGGWIDRYGYPFARGRVFDICEKDNGQYDANSPVFWASGAALCIRSSVFRETGGFDPYFFAHQEEIDLCWRIQLAGYEVWCTPASVVYHVGGGTLPRGNSLKTFLNFRNNRIMLSKNLPLSQKLWVMPVRNFLDGVSAWKGLFKGDGGYFVAVVRAQLAFVKWWLFHRKRSVFPLKKERTVKGMWRGNIAWQHFVKKRKYFSEIVKPLFLHHKKGR